MEKRTLGNSDLAITPLGVGAWAMGGGWNYGFGPQDDQQSIAAIRAALDAGWNWIDTAAVYGLGHSEEVVGRALEGLAHRPHVFTKCGMRWDSAGKLLFRLKRDSVREECEASLRRLRLDAIDLYQIHWPNPAEDIEEGWEALVRLREQGKIRWAGVCNFDVQPPGCGHVAAAALFHRHPGGGGGNPALLPGSQPRRDRIQPHAVGTALRQDDHRAGPGPS